MPDREISLPPHCATTAAEDLRVQLVMAIETGKPVTVNASRVEMLGQAVLQILIGARAEAVRTGCCLSIEAPSPAFVSRVTACRASELIGLEAKKDEEN